MWSENGTNKIGRWYVNGGNLILSEIALIIIYILGYLSILCSVVAGIVLIACKFYWGVAILVGGLIINYFLFFILIGLQKGHINFLRRLHVVIKKDLVYKVDEKKPTIVKTSIVEDTSKIKINEEERKEIIEESENLGDVVLLEDIKASKFEPTIIPKGKKGFMSSESETTYSVRFRMNGRMYVVDVLKTKVEKIK